MSYNQDSVRGEWMGSVRYTEMDSFNMTDIRQMMQEILAKKGIPAMLSMSEYVTGSFFSKTRSPLLLIDHPDPNCKFFTLGIYANQNILNFPLFGESAENTKNNKYEYYKTQGTGLKATFYKPDTMKLQQEAAWQMSVSDCINELSY